MFQLIPKISFDFVSKRYTCFLISGILILVGVFSLIQKKGPKWGLDFTGGTLVEVKFGEPPPVDEIRSALTQAGINSFEIQSISGNGIIVRAQLSEEFSEDKESEGLSSETSERQPDQERNKMGWKIFGILEKTFIENTPQIMRNEYVGPTVGQHLFKQIGFASLLAFFLIICYVGYRFHSPVWGAAGVLALVHDVFITFGILSLLDKEITIVVVAALLTVAGYSINDTIVIFDFMREKKRLMRTEPLDKIINLSINQSLSRTINTTLTVLFVVLILFFFGGEVIHDMAFTLVLGSIVGTYSSIGIAASLVYQWSGTQKKR